MLEDWYFFKKKIFNDLYGICVKDIGRNEKSSPSSGVEVPIYIKSLYIDTRDNETTKDSNIIYNLYGIILR